MLRPGYAPPTRKRIACQLLDKVFDELTQATATLLEGKNVTLIQDGWSDVHNSPVIVHSLHTGQKYFFLNFVDTGTNKKTATYCASLATKASEEATNKFGCRIVAIVTDNERKMQSMRSKLKSDDDSLCLWLCIPFVKPGR